MDRPASRTVAMWATCALLTLGGYQLALSPGRSSINVIAILVLLGIVAGASLIAPSARALSLLILGMLLAWQLPLGWLLAILPPDIAREAHDVGWIGALTVLVMAVVMAVWRRPPTRRPDGTSIVEARLVYGVALLCAIGGPLFSLATLSVSTTNLYLRPAVFGLPVGLFGVILFGAYWAFHTVIGRARPAAILALAYPALLLVAVQGPRWVAPRSPVPEVIVESTLLDGRLVRASGASPDQAPANATDGRTDTAWNAAKHPPAWIEIDLGEPATIAEIRLLVAQSPGGPTIHHVVGIDSIGRVSTLAEFRGDTRDGQWLTQTLIPPVVDVQKVRITTLASPSWVAWSEIELVPEGP